MENNDKNAKRAFKWIVKILRKYKIPFQITGGLAAKVYGGKRPLLDIDIDVPNNRLEDILPDVQGKIVSGPRWDLVESFKVFLLRLDYRGQQIDVSGALGQKIYNSSKKKWIDCPVNLSDFEEHEVFGVKVPVISKKDLIEYKKILGREVDLEDLRDLTSGK